METPRGSFPLIKEEAKELLAQLEEEEKQRRRQRLEVLYLIRSGAVSTRSEVAAKLGVHRHTISRWLEAYARDGLEGMLEIKTRPNRKRVVPKGVQNALKKKLTENHGFLSYADVQAWVKETHGLEVHYKTLYRLVRYELKMDLQSSAPSPEAEAAEAAEKKTGGWRPFFERLTRRSAAKEPAPESPSAPAPEATPSGSPAKRAPAAPKQRAEARPAIPHQPRETQEPQAQPPSAAEVLSGLNQARRIVLAEDDELTASVLRHRIEREGWEVISCVEGEAVFSAVYGKEPVDLLILNTTIPGVSGFEVLKQLRAEQSLKHLPIVMLAWPGNDQALVRAFDLGADDFMLKPFSPMELMARIRRLMAQRPASVPAVPVMAKPVPAPVQG